MNIDKARQMETMKALALRYKAVTRYNQDTKCFEYYNNAEHQWCLARLTRADMPRSPFEIFVEKTKKYLAKVYHTKARYTHLKGFQVMVANKWTRIDVDIPGGLL